MVDDLDDEVWLAVRRQQAVVATQLDVLNLMDRSLRKRAKIHHERGDLSIQLVRSWYQRSRRFNQLINEFVKAVKPRLPYHIRLIINGETK